MSNSSELGVKYFIATQFDEKMQREHVGVQDKERVRIEVIEKVRQTIEELGGTMPEDLPLPDKSVKTIEAEQRRQLQAGDDE